MAAGVLAWDPRPARGGCPARAEHSRVRRQRHDRSGHLVRDSAQGTINFTPAMSALGAIGWLAYVSIVMTLFILKVRTPKPARTAP